MLLRIMEVTFWFVDPWSVIVKEGLVQIMVNEKDEDEAAVPAVMHENVR